MPDIKVKDLASTTSLSVDNQIMLLTDDVANTVKNIEVSTFLDKIISSDSDNSLTTGSDSKIYNEAASVTVGDLTDLTTTDKTTAVNAINELNSDIGSLSSLDTTDKNSIVGAINELTAIIDPTLQYETMNNSKALLTGATSTNAIILSDIVNYAHSTFDSSKFTAVGTPVISGNGIVSGFSSSNYLTFDAKIPSYNTFDLYLGEYTITSLPATGYRYWLYLCAINNAGINSGFEMSIEPSGKTRYFLGTGDSNWDIAQGLTDGAKVYAVGQKVKFKLNFDGSKYTLYSSINGGAWAEDWHKDSTAKILLPQTTQISQGSVNYFPGTIDLKYIKSIFDGVSVFSGCKTGVDTIKPDDFTVNGTLSEVGGGIYSGFSGSNYLSKAYELTNDYNTLEIDFGEIIMSASAHGQWFFDARETVSSITKGVWFQFTDGRLLKMFLGSGDSNWDIASGTVSTIAYPLNKKIRVKLVFTGTQYILYSSIDGADWQAAITVDSTKKVSFDTTIKLGTDGSANSLDGFYDVNGVKIIKDGNIVYQACLKVPYTLSNTGSKIADIYYYNRVADIYEQFGNAPYYCLDEVNSAFSLPFGELYGFINTAANDYNKINTTTGVTITAPYTAEKSGWISVDCESFSDGAKLTCEINGVQVSNFQLNGAVAVTSCAIILPPIPIKKGDVFTTYYIPSAYSQFTLKFYENVGA